MHMLAWVLAIGLLSVPTQKPATVCGTELWLAKVLVDPAAAQALARVPLNSTIQALTVLPRSSARRRYTVVGTVAVVKSEADSDLHIILRDGASTIIIEAAHPDCAIGSKAYVAIAKARKQAEVLKVGQRVRVTGMLFFDKIHGQTGVAPNGVELHPILSITVL